MLVNSELHSSAVLTSEVNFSILLFYNFLYCKFAITLGNLYSLLKVWKTLDY
jgi:hypothetical protein